MGHVVKSFGRVVPRAALDANARVEVLLAEARREAEAIVAAARAEAQAVRASVHEQALETARDQAAAELTALLGGARREAERIRAEALPVARALAGRMAEKIVGRAIEADPRVLVEIAAQALSAARVREGALTLRAHPDDLAALSAARGTLFEALGAAVRLTLVADATVGRHGCVVESAAGRLDARLATQIAALERVAFGAPAAVTGARDG